MEKAKTRTQKEWKEYLQDLLDRSDKAVVEALLRIYDNQTPYEKELRRVVHSNNIGFNAIDVVYMSMMARKELLGRRLNKQGVDQHDIRMIRRSIKKYWKQLMFLSIEKQKNAERIARENVEAEEELIISKQLEMDFHEHLRVGDYSIPDEGPTLKENEDDF